MVPASRPREVAAFRKGRSTRPVALLRDLCTVTPHLVAEFATVLCGAEAFELDVYRVERVVFAGLPDARVDNLFVVLPTLGAELGR